MPFRLGPWEIALMLVIVLVIFGAGKLPQIGGAIGKTVRDFRKASKEDGGDAASAGIPVHPNGRHTSR